MIGTIMKGSQQVGLAVKSGNLSGLYPKKSEGLGKAGCVAALSECLPFSNASFRERHWQVWEWVVTSRNSSYVTNEVMLQATCGKKVRRKKEEIFLCQEQ